MRSKCLKRGNSKKIRLPDKVKYSLDYINGAYDSCVLGYSYFRLGNKHKTACCRVIRGSDYSEKDICFTRKGYIDIGAVINFCSGTTGKVTKLYNQSSSTGAEDAVQTTYNNMTVIYESGAFKDDGVNFVAASSNYMSVTDYSAIQIINPSLSIYCNYTPTLDKNGYAFSKRDASNRQYAFGSWSTTMYFYTNDAENRSIAQANGTLNKLIIVWADKNADGVSIKNQTASASKTLNTTLTNYAGFFIGSSWFSNYFDGNMKTLLIFNSNQYDNYTQLAIVA